MKHMVLSALLVMQSCLITDAFAQAPVLGTLDIKVKGIAENKPIPEKFAYCAADGKGRTKNVDDITPAISWSGAPKGTQSYALIVVDPDVPANFDNANKPDKTIAADAPRTNFYHWTLVDIPAKTKSLAEIKDKRTVNIGKASYGINGVNGFGFPGYDGPCPPWNDERLHHYHFKLYALDVPSLKLPEPVKAMDAEAALKGHVLAQGEVVGTYTTHP